MTLTTSTTHADLTITASLDTETLRVSYDVDGIWAGDGKWTDRRGGSATDCGALLVRDDDDATDAVYSALDAGLRAQLAAQPARVQVKAKHPTLDSLLASMRSGALSGRDTDWSDLPNYGGAPVDALGVWSWDETRLLVGECSSDVTIVDRTDW